MAEGSRINQALASGAAIGRIMLAVALFDGAGRVHVALPGYRLVPAIKSEAEAQIVFQRRNTPPKISTDWRSGENIGK